MIYEAYQIYIAFIKVKHCCELFCVRIYSAWITFIITYIFIDKLTIDNIRIVVVFQQVTYKIKVSWRRDL